MRVAGHRPRRMRGRLDGEHVHQGRQRLDGLARGIAAVKPQVKGHLVVARAPGVQRGARGRDLGQPALDGGVDVFVGGKELEVAGVKLASDAAQAALDRGKLGRGEQARRLEPTCMGDAALDVIRVQLVLALERRSESLELGQHLPAEAPAPQLLARRLRGYGASLLTSPRRALRSRSCSRPWTRAEVRIPIPHSLMKPAAADWSNWSPLP